DKNGNSYKVPVGGALKITYDSLPAGVHDCENGSRISADACQVESNVYSSTNVVEGEITARLFEGTSEKATIKIPYSNKPGVTASYKCTRDKANYDMSNGIEVVSGDAYVSSSDALGKTKLGSGDGTDKLVIVGATVNGAAKYVYTITAVDQYGLSNFKADFGPIVMASDANFGSGNAVGYIGSNGNITLKGSKTESYKLTARTNANQIN
nr:hypothetical protein [Lachnospiraceae bacterium]